MLSGGFADLYDREYFENGIASGISGYANYSWMPELTIRMAHFMMCELGILPGMRILDYGCAKGFLVKAFRLLDLNAFGADVSHYAIENVDSSVRNYCFHLKDEALQREWLNGFDWFISKDVFEHLSEDEITYLLLKARETVKKMFLIIPLAPDDLSGKFVVPAYDLDVTHCTVKSLDWWLRTFDKIGWKSEQHSYSFKGCKENWTGRYPTGNGFFVLA